jgi:bacterioferritin-associated ferredoxin
MGDRKCPRCTEPGFLKSGNQWLCPRHYRFTQMRVSAKGDGKTVPSHEQLAAMVPTDMRCPDCQRAMNWLSRDGRATVLSLQHYRDGTMSLVCLSCNRRHAFAPGDSFRTDPKDSKWCPVCKKLKHRSEYFAHPGQSHLGIRSRCKTCDMAAREAWVDKNREYYNAYRKAWKAKRRAQNNT